MIRSVLSSVGLVCLMAATAAAQITGNNYWEAIPPEVAGGPAKPAPPPIIPNVPFAPVRNVPVLAKLKIDKDFKLLGPYAPLWLGTKSVALLGTRRGQVTLLAWDSERLVSPRVVVDPSTIHGGAILDMAMSRDGKRVAIAAAAGDNLQVWLRDTQSDAQASIVATIDGRCDKAGIAWLDANTVAVGAQMEQSAPPPPAQSPIIMPGQPQQPAAAPQPSNNLYIAQLGQQKSPARIDLECLGHVDPTTLTWSPEGSHAVAVSEEQGKWMLIDRAKATCAEIKLPNIVPAKFIDWGDKAQRFLFTATPARFPDPGHVGVMEYSLAAHKARLIASPATAAAYVGGGRIVALGSQRLNAAAMAANPDALFPAQIAWVDPGQSELNIVPTGFASSATELLHAHLVYSAAKGLLATAFQTPNPKGEFSVLMWISAVAHSGGVLGTGKMGTMLLSWSPDGSRLAVLAGLPDHPTLAIVAAPQ